jgi:hypothetical protein
MRCFLSLLALSYHGLSLLTEASALPKEPPSTDDKAWGIEDLFSGNQRFIKEVNSEYPGLLEQTGQKQEPPFLFLGCSDSR